MTPGACEHELSTLVLGKSTKSLCDLAGREIWTTCRDWGRCTLERYADDVTDECEDEPDDCEPEPIDNERERIEANESESEQMTLW